METAIAPRRAHPPNHTLKNQSPTARAAGTAAARAYGIQLRCLSSVMLTRTFAQYPDIVLYIRICITKVDNAEEKTPNFVGRGHVC